MLREQAIKECQALWEEIAESGLSKNDFLRTKAGKKWLAKDYRCNCPLCELAAGKPPQIANCYECLLVEQYEKSCGALGFSSFEPPSDEWMKAVRGLR